MARPLSAVVIGGGIAGLTTAIALDRAGIGVEVYRARRHARRNRRGHLDLAERPPRVRRNRPRGRDQDPSACRQARRACAGGTGACSSVRSTRRWRAASQTSPSSCTARICKRVLLDALGRDRVRLGKACVSVAQDERGIAATFADGHVARGDALIGADGLHSVVRDRASRRSSRRATPATRPGAASCRSIHAKVRPGESWGPGRRFGQMPMSHGPRVLVRDRRTCPRAAVLAAGEKAELAAAVQRLARADRGARRRDAATRAILRNDIYDRPPLARWGDRPHHARSATPRIR